MIKQNVFIINFDSLYEILDEIKENLSFNLIKYENINDFIKDPNLDLLNCLIISQPNQKLLINKNTNEKNFLNIDKFPLPLNKLLQLINIQLIKLKFN